MSNCDDVTLIFCVWVSWYVLVFLFAISIESNQWETTRNALSAKMVTFDPVYKALSDEKLLGWQSGAVSALWKSRTRKFKVQSSGNRAEDSKKFTPEEGKYFKFYTDVLPLYAPGLFVKSFKQELFIDIGSAPGGLSKYLITACGWRGYAFSLSPSEGGLEMRYSNPSSLLFSMSNMTRENEWSRVVSLCAKEGFTDVHFVNTGVVVDFGQVDADGGGSSEMTCRSIGSSISQMLIILKCLKSGGSAMWIHSLSHLDTLFFFLQYIVPCFDSIRLLNTLAPARSPIYIIMSGFKKGSAAAATFEKALLRNNGTVSPTTVPMWQVDDFAVVERIMNENPSLTNDLHAIWNQKKECLRETRLFAEKKFSECGNDDNKFNATSQACHTVLAGVEQRLSPTLLEEVRDRKTHTNTLISAAGVCGVSSKESVKTQGSLLTIPKSFGPPPRKKL